MSAMRNAYLMAAGFVMAILLMGLAAAGPASKLVGTWGIDIPKLKEKNASIKAMPSAEQAAIEKELGKLSFVFDEKTVIMEDSQGEKTSNPYTVVSETDPLVVLEMSQEGGASERLRIRFSDGRHMELIREGDEESLFLVKK